jgi:hypothetical protein
MLLDSCRRSIEQDLIAEAAARRRKTQKTLPKKPATPKPTEKPKEPDTKPKSGKPTKIGADLLNKKSPEKAAADRKKAQATALNTEKDALTRQESQISATRRTNTAAIQRDVLAGKTTKEDAEVKTQEVEVKSTQAQKHAVADSISRINQLKKQGAISNEQYASRSAELAKKQGTLESQLVQQQLNLQEKKNRKIIEGFERANAAAENALARASTQRKTTAQSALLAPQPGQDRAAAEFAIATQLREIDADTTRRRIALATSELALVKKLRSQGVYTAQQAAEKEMEFQDQIASENSKLVDLEIQGQGEIRTEIERRYDLQLTSIETVLNKELAAQDAVSNSLKSQSELSNARMGLQQAQSSLAEKRLEIQLSEAKSDQERYGIEQKLAALRATNLTLRQQGELDSLALTQAQNRLELQRQTILDKIAEAEARIALIKARRSGASAEEIADLQQILDLRKQSSAQTKDAFAQLGQTQQIELQTKLTSQQQEREEFTVDTRNQLRNAKTAADQPQQPETVEIPAPNVQVQEPQQTNIQVPVPTVELPQFKPIQVQAPDINVPEPQVTAPQSPQVQIPEPELKTTKTALPPQTETTLPPVNVPVEQPDVVDVHVVQPEPIQVSVVKPEPVNTEVIAPNPVDVPVNAPPAVGIDVTKPEPVQVSTLAPGTVEVPVVQPQPVTVQAVEPNPVQVHTVEPPAQEVPVVPPEPVAVNTVAPELTQLQVVNPEPVEVKVVSPYHFTKCLPQIKRQECMPILSKM